MSELPDTDIWAGEQRRKKTGRAKQIHWDAYEQNTGAKCHKLNLCVCTEIWPLQTNFLQWFYLVGVQSIMTISYSIVTSVLVNQDFRGGVTTSIPKKHCKTFMFFLEGFDPALIKGWNK